MKNFDAWNEVKKALDGSAHCPYFKEGEIWFSSIGLNVGDEEDGKNAKFERPVLILRRFNSRIFIGVPLSSIAKPDNKYYLSIEFKGKKVSIIVSQVRLFSAKRLRRRMGILRPEQLHKVSQAVNDRISPLMTGNKKRTLAGQSPRGPKAFVRPSLLNNEPNVKLDEPFRSYVDREIWTRKDIFEQMGGIYSAVCRTLDAQDQAGSIKALDSAIDLFDATVESLLKSDKPYRIKEVLQAKHEFLRLLYIDHTVEEEQSLKRYFQYFAVAAANPNSRQFA